jgi:hypothetical protein
MLSAIFTPAFSAFVISLLGISQGSQFEVAIKLLYPSRTRFARSARASHKSARDQLAKSGSCVRLVAIIEVGRHRASPLLLKTAAGASTYAVDSACAVVVEVASELSRH